MNDRERHALHDLVRKWIAQANHPQLIAQPEVRNAMLKCASDLSDFLRKATVPEQFPDTTPEGRLLRAVFGKKDRDNLDS